MLFLIRNLENFVLFDAITVHEAEHLNASLDKSEEKEVTEELKAETTAEEQRKEAVEGTVSGMNVTSVAAAGVTSGAPLSKGTEGHEEVCLIKSKIVENQTECYFSGVS